MIDKFCELVAPCKNGGTCLDAMVFEEYTCVCLKGFFGKHCEFSHNQAGFYCWIFLTLIKIINLYHFDIKMEKSNIRIL